MKIAIDASSVLYGTGVSVYTKNLVENLLRIDKENEYILFGGSLRRIKNLKSILSKFKADNREIKVIPIPPTLGDLIWNRLHTLPIEKLLGDIDVFHSSDWTQPPSAALKVTTIHDLVPVKFPKLSDPKIVSTHERRFNWVKKEVDRIIVPSSVTANDLVKMGADKGEIRVIPEAPDPSFIPANKSQIEKLKVRYRITGKYVLAVGVNPRKNTQRIIDAFEKIKAETGLKLIIIGYPYLNLHERRGVIFTGHFPQQDLPTLYSGAEVLAYPSLYEGFGLPILEAFACKLPVVTSNFGSMAEVAGNAAVLVDPYDIDSIAEGLLKTMKNRNALIEKGLARVKHFSWGKTAKETLKVYNEAKV